MYPVCLILELTRHCKDLLMVEVMHEDINENTVISYPSLRILPTELFFVCLVFI